MGRDCIFEYCDCRGASPALREAIHQRDAAMVDNRWRVARNTPESEILDEVVRFIERDMSVEELESRIDMIVADWADLGVAWV